MNIFEAVWEARTPLIWSMEPTFGEWLREVFEAQKELENQERPIFWEGEYMQLTRSGWVRLWSGEDPEALARAGCVQWRGEPCLPF